MKDDNFKIVVITKEFLFDINDILCRFPNNEKVLRDKLKSSMYDVIELIYEANFLPLNKYKEERIKLQIKILSKISLIDLLIEEAYRKGYLSESIFHNKSAVLTNLRIKVKGWIAYEKNNSEASA